MAEHLPEGLYDLLINDDLHAKLNPSRARLRPLDVVEASRLAEVLHRQLVGILDDMATGNSVTSQFQLVNKLIVGLRPTRQKAAAEQMVDPVHWKKLSLTLRLEREGCEQDPPREELGSLGQNEKAFQPPMISYPR